MAGVFIVTASFILLADLMPKRLAMTNTEAGVLKAQEHYLIANIFDMQQRTVISTMTTHENVIFLDRTLPANRCWTSSPKTPILSC